MSGTMEVLYPDGSRSEFTEGGGSFHEGDLAMERLRLIMAKSALSLYIKTDGKMQVTRNGATLAIRNVIEPLTGKTYKRSMKGKAEALADCEALIAAIEQAAVVYDPSQPLCDECGVADEETVWCGNCGCCRAHCRGFEGCGDE